MFFEKDGIIQHGLVPVNENKVNQVLMEAERNRQKHCAH